MKKHLYIIIHKIIKCYFLCFFVIFISINSQARCQDKRTTNSNVEVQKNSNFIVSSMFKVGDILSTTGMKQDSPQISHISAVAPDILCIEIDACRIIPCIQIPYQPDPTDVISEQYLTDLGESRK